MARPDERGFRRLPTLASASVELETCTFCPKLCRTACPVSNAEPRETLTPWGKMSSAYHLARGDVDAGQDADKGFAEAVFACTNCGACTHSCDHQNPVGMTLNLARDAVRQAGLAPPGATRVLAGFAAHEAETHARARAIDPLPAASPGQGAPRGPVALVAGCGYLREAEPEARAALAVARALAGEEVTLVGGCCGLPLLHAGDDAGFTAHLGRFVASLSGFDQILALDPGCARALKVTAKLRGVGSAQTERVELLVERAAKELHRLQPLTDLGAVRYHDPCQLGRGLGVYEAPRAVLTRLGGKPPEEFVHRREGAACSGAGGLLPVTHPEIAATAARARIDEHTRAGGGTLVTACASSLRAFRAAGERTEDLVSLIARGLAASEGEPAAVDGPRDS